MSIPAINWCIEQKDLPPGEWVVLFHLCHCHNHETGRCDPSQEYLAEMTNMGGRTVRRHLSSLQERGRIYRKKRGVEGGGRLSDYYVLGHEPAKLAEYVTGQSMRTNRPIHAEKMHEMAGKQEVTGIEQDLPPVVPQAASKPKKARLPDDWSPNEANLKFAHKNNFHPDDIDELANDFRIYWTEATGKSASKSQEGWDQTWRNHLNSYRGQNLKRNRQFSQQRGETNGRPENRFDRKQQGSDFVNKIAAGFLDGSVTHESLEEH